MLFFNRSCDVAKLQKLQNRCLRMCFNVYNPCDVSVRNLHNNAKLFPLSDRREIQILNIIYDLKNDERYLRVHTRHTRQAMKIVFKTNIAQSEIYKRSLFFVGNALWNNLPLEIESKLVFKGIMRETRIREFRV